MDRARTQAAKHCVELRVAELDPGRIAVPNICIDAGNCRLQNFGHGNKALSLAFSSKLRQLCYRAVQDFIGAKIAAHGLLSNLLDSLNDLYPVAAVPESRDITVQSRHDRHCIADAVNVSLTANLISYAPSFQLGINSDPVDLEILEKHLKNNAE